MSVIVAAFNSEATIGQTIQSVIHQTDPAWELIIVDDGSTDETSAVASGFADDRITVIRQSNMGTASARNAGMAASQGRWLCALDADDLLLPCAVGNQRQFIEANPGFDIYSTNADVLLPDGSCRPFDSSGEYQRSVSFRLDDLLDRNRLLSFAFVLKEAVLSIGGYRDVYVEDYDLWLRLLARGYRHLHNPQTLASYRQSIGSKNADLVRSMESTIDVLETLARDASLTQVQHSRIHSSVAQWKAEIARVSVEDRLRREDYEHVRRDFIRARRAYVKSSKWLIGFVAVLLSPRLLRRLLSSKRGW